MSRAARGALIAAAVALGFGIRLWHARDTGFVHMDEVHTATDGLWSVWPYDAEARWRFVRGHVRDHPLLHLRDGRMMAWAGERPPHPGFGALVHGVVLGLRGSTDWSVAVRVVRVLNAVADSATIALLPLLVAAAGGGAAMGVGAAFLYAVFPPAVVFGSLANQEVLAVPLVVLALVLAAAPGAGFGRALAAGVATGLACAADRAGVAALAMTPIALAAGAARPAVALPAWAVAAVASLVALVEPVGWLVAMLTTTTWREPLAALRENAGWLVQSVRWYWTGFERHPTPLAPGLAYVNVVAAPLVFVAAAGAAVWTLVRRRWREVLAFWLPAALVLALVPPSNGVFRVHAAFPLACGGLVTAAASLGVLRTMLLVAVAAVVAVRPLLPDRLDADGRVDLVRVLATNPRHDEGAQLVAPGAPVRIALAAGEPPLVRRLWLAPGRWVLETSTDGWLHVEMDGKPVIVPGSHPRPVRRVEVDLEGRLHTIAISSPVAASRVFGITLRPAAPPGGQPVR